jgi:hypothetical protein
MEPRSRRVVAEWVGHEHELLGGRIVAQHVGDERVVRHMLDPRCRFSS